MLKMITRTAFLCVFGITVASAQVPGIRWTPAPQFTGPIPVAPQSNEPYRGDNEQPVAGPGLPPPLLIPYGYVEEEYFVSGTVDGKAYTTSILVRKPKDPAKFSGLVAVETVHNAGALPYWGLHDLWLSGGHGWVAVGSQRIALEEHIKKSNPARYASLNIPDVTPPGADPMAGAGGGPQDKFSQAIMTQVGALLKSNLPDGPFAGLNVRYLVMGGASQTGGATLRYIAEAHAQARMAGGKPIYDGYEAQEAFPSKPLPAVDAIVVNPTTEGDLMNALAAKREIGIRPDSDDPLRGFRHYEIPGASHIGTRGVTDIAAVFSALKGSLLPSDQLSQFPHAEIRRAITHNFIEWVMKGTLPPKGSPIEVVNGEIVRDEFGNAKGGIRSPYLDLPTVHYIAVAIKGPADNPSRRLIGLQDPIPVEKLKSMYKSRADYLKRFDKEIDRMVKERWLFAKDGEELKAEETKSPPF